jgi:hypothetical protein
LESINQSVAVAYGTSPKVWRFAVSAHNYRDHLWNCHACTKNRGSCVLEHF